MQIIKETLKSWVPKFHPPIDRSVWSSGSVIFNRLTRAYIPIPDHSLGKSAGSNALEKRDTQ